MKYYWQLCVKPKLQWTRVLWLQSPTIPRTWIRWPRIICCYIVTARRFRSENSLHETLTVVGGGRHSIWQRWLREYLPALQYRHRWQEPRRNFKVDDVVILMDDSLPKNCWSLGRVVGVLPGRDSLVRSVRIKTSTSAHTRSISKICLFEARDTWPGCGGQETPQLRDWHFTIIRLLFVLTNIALCLVDWCELN